MCFAFGGSLTFFTIRPVRPLALNVKRFPAVSGAVLANAGRWTFDLQAALGSSCFARLLSQAHQNIM